MCFPSVKALVQDRRGLGAPPPHASFAPLAILSRKEQPAAVILPVFNKLLNIYGGKG